MLSQMRSPRKQQNGGGRKIIYQETPFAFGTNYKTAYTMLQLQVVVGACGVTQFTLIRCG